MSRGIFAELWDFYGGSLLRPHKEWVNAQFGRARLLTPPNRIESYRTRIALMGAPLAVDAVVLDVVDYLRERLNVIVGVRWDSLTDNF